MVLLTRYEVSVHVTKRFGELLQMCCNRTVLVRLESAQIATALPMGTQVVMHATAMGRVFLNPELVLVKSLTSGTRVRTLTAQMTAVAMANATSILANVHATQILSSTPDRAVSSKSAQEGAILQLANVTGTMAFAFVRWVIQVRHASKTLVAAQLKTAHLKPTGGPCGTSLGGLHAHRGS